MPKKGKNQAQTKAAPAPAVSNKPIPEQQKLPRQLDDLIRASLKHYQNNHFDKAIENCKKVLANYPANGEAFSLLAASEYSKDKSKVNPTDILARLKKGLTYNLGSPTCWHLYGIILRQEKNYAEACKTYKRLTMMDKSNFGLYRELYYLQIHTGDYKGALESRAVLASAHPNERTNIVGKAVAADLKGDTKNAIEIIEQFKKTQKLDETQINGGLSDIIHYLCSLYKQIGENQKALDILLEHEYKLFDKVTTMEKIAELYHIVNNNEKSIETYKKLLTINPDNISYYTGIAKALGKEVNNLGEKTEEFIAICKEYAKKDEDTASVMILRSLPANDEFKTMFKKCLIRLIQKHIITVNKLLLSIFKEETSFESAKKYEIYATLLNELKSELTDKEDQEFIVLTQTIRLIVKNEIAEARKEFDSITIEKETIDNLMVKARLIKKEGDLKQAAEVMDAARKLDTADRYIANRTAKYYLRYGNVEKGLATFKLFDRPPEKNDSPTKFEERLDDLEVVWFMTEYANGFFVAGKLDDAERYAKRVIKAYTTFVDDLFDFHGYVLDRFSYDTYLSCVRHSKLYGNSQYKQRATKLLEDIEAKRKEQA